MYQYMYRHINGLSPYLTPLPTAALAEIRYGNLPEDLRNAYFRYAAARDVVFNMRTAKQYGAGQLEYSLATCEVNNLQKKYNIRYIFI
jgi:hypothetical protein